MEFFSYECIKASPEPFSIRDWCYARRFHLLSFRAANESCLSLSRKHTTFNTFLPWEISTARTSFSLAHNPSTSSPPIQRLLAIHWSGKRANWSMLARNASISSCPPAFCKGTHHEEPHLTKRMLTTAERGYQREFWLEDASELFCTSKDFLCVEWGGA